MLERADAAILIGDPALLALEEHANRFERTGEMLVYHDMAEELHALTGLPFVSAVWGIACSSPLVESIAEGFCPIPRPRQAAGSRRAGRRVVPPAFPSPNRPSAPT